jgi:hypothetical protein
MPKPWVKWAYQPARAQDIPAAFMRAHAAAIQPPAGPVFLSLPLDDWAAPALGPAVVRTASARTGPDPARLRRLADAIAGAERPVLIFGAAVARASGWDQAVALAEKMDAPVWAAPASERAPFPRIIRCTKAACRSRSGRWPGIWTDTTWPLSSARPSSATTPTSPAITCRTACGCGMSPTIPPRPPAPRSGTASSATRS